jgi:hypothetical protein
MEVSMGSDWQTSGTVAWTKRDGMSPPPKGANPWLLGAIAITMCGVWVGMIATDALCPDHRLWVQTLASVALVGSVAAIAGLLLQWSWATWMAFGSAVVGIAIGFIDTIHDPTRGALISLAFAVVAVLLVVASVPQARSALWPRRASRDMHVDPAQPTVGNGSPAQTVTPSVERPGSDRESVVHRVPAGE